MVKKFKEKWNKLTTKQQVILRIVLSIVTTSLYGVFLALCITIPIIGFAFLLIIGSIFVTIVMLFLYMWFFIIRKEEKLLKFYKGKLSEDEFTEIFFRTDIVMPKGPAGELYWYKEHCEEPHFFAKRQEDNIYVELMDKDELIAKWMMNLNFLHFYFNHIKDKKDH